MSLFDSGGGIITNHSVLSEDFVPQEILHREGQKKTLASLLAPIARGGSPSNAFLYGPPGTGKTSLAKWILREFENYTDRASTTYTNAWDLKTPHAVLGEIARSLGVFASPREPVSGLLSLIDSFLRKKNKKLVVCIDEVDQLRDPDDILYSLSRRGYALVLVSNDPHALVGLDTRVKSSLSLEEIEFPAYKTEELIDILENRARHALSPGAVSRDLLRVIAHSSQGDARRAILLLRRAALAAESEGLEEITPGIVKRIVREESPRDRLSVALSSAMSHPHQSVIVRILKEKGELSSGDLYREYSSRVENPLTERAYRNHMEELASKGIVVPVGSGRWRRYRLSEDAVSLLASGNYRQ